MSMARTKKVYFGTDGMRGTANRHPMSADVALRLGMSAGSHFSRGTHKHRVLVGKDTRLSGYMLEPALTAGFVSVGMDVILVGPMPTPAVAMLTRSLRADLGLMLSASHNLYQDNGIKLFGPDGYKLSEAEELAIESGIEHGVEPASPGSLGRVKRLEDENGRYLEHLKSTYRSRRTLEGLKIVVDCANGAAYRAAPAVLTELGADIVVMNAEPDGFNINKECGSTAPESMCAAVLTHSADAGIALDGDADRIVVADEKGRLLDGDQLIAMIARRWSETGRLRRNHVVATVMSNLGLEKYLDTIGLTLHRVQVGDKHVLEYMRGNDINLGGEQSGHIILSDFSTTGDGLLAALQVLALMIDEGRPLSEVSHSFEPVPQILRNVHISCTESLEHPKVKAVIQDAKRQLGAEGRLVIRPSGTEPLVRVMAEGQDELVIDSIVDSIVGTIEEVKNNIQQ